MILRIAAILVGLVGLVWIGQGIGWIQGSVMTNESKWAYIGTAMVLAALVTLFLTRKRKSS